MKHLINYLAFRGAIGELLATVQVLRGSVQVLWDGRTAAGSTRSRLRDPDVISRVDAIIETTRKGKRR